MAESLSDEQLAELRDRCTAEVWFGLSREEARALLADNERLQAAVQLLGANLQGSARVGVDALAEVERRIPVEHVERFLKRERDEYEPRGECWNTVDDVLDVFRLHMVTGTPLTEPRPVEGPEAYGVGDEPLTEAEELRAEVERLRAQLEDWHGREHRHEYVLVGPDGDPNDADPISERAANLALERPNLDLGTPWIRTVSASPWTRYEQRHAEPGAPQLTPTPALSGGCTCDTAEGPCPACQPDADALTGALTDEAHAPGGTHV